MGRFGNGRVENHSSKELWVVAEGKAHILRPNRRSASDVDADGARAKDGTPIDGHKSWWKVNDLGTLVISDGANGQLTKGWNFGTTSKVEDGEFGKLTYDETDGWGEPLS
jgi:hypothetical protein